MIVSTVLDVLNAEVGSVIPAVTGKLTKLYKRTSDTGQYGEWSVQNGELSDGKNTIRLSVWNHEDLIKFRNKTIYIEAGLIKNKLAHLTFVENEYPKNSGKMQQELKVEGKATIALGSGPDGNEDEGQTDEDPRDVVPPKKANTPPPAKNNTPSGPVTLADLDIEARRDAMRLGNLRVMAERTADYVVSTYQANTGKRVHTEDQVTAIATGIFIELNKMGHTSAMPGKPVSLPGTKAETPPPPPPPPPPAPADDEDVPY